MTAREKSQSPYANEAAKLPSLPTVRLTDPQMQRFVDALRVWIDARAGARDPYERGVTMRDLVEMGIVDAKDVTRSAMRGFGTGGATPPSVLVETGSSYVKMSIDAFAKSIMDTALFRNLMKSLDDPSRFDSLPEEIKAILLKEITDEAAARGADIRRIESKLQSESKSLAYKVEEVTAAVEKAAAGVRVLTYAKATADSATAGQITQINARLDNVALPANAVIDAGGPYANLAALQAAVTSPRRGVYYRVDDPASADVDDILLYLWSPGLGFYLAGKANDDTGTLIYSAKLEEQMIASVDRATGMEAQYTLKVQAGGAIGGFGIAATDNGAGGISSHFIISADKFAVVAPGDTLTGAGTVASPYSPPANRVPFGIDTTNNTIYINGNVRINTNGPTLATVGDTVTITGQQAYLYASDSSTPTPSSITLSAALTGTLTTYDWEYHNGTSWVNLGGTNTNQTYALAHDNAAWSTNSLRVRCVSGSASDEITMHKVRDGTNSKTGWLTNEAVAVAAENDGTGYSLTGAGGTFKVYNGITDVTTSSTFSISSGTDGGANWTKVQNGLTMTINETTGAYSLSGASWTTDTESFTLVATYGGVTINKVYTISKAKKGAVGTSGTSVYVGTIYQQAASATGPTNGTGSYNFSTGTLTPPSGWVISAPTVSTTPTWMSEFRFSTTTPGSTVTAGTWSTPVVDAQRGSDGNNGVSTYTLEVFKNGDSVAPTSTTATYNFNTDTFTAGNLTSGWTRAQPASSTTPTYRSAWTFTTTTPGTNVTANGTWSTPVIVAQNGSQGTRGTRQLYDTSASYTASYNNGAGAGAASYAAQATTLIASATSGSTPTTPINGDTVTFTNGTNYTYTITHNGTSWAPPGVVIDGSLLVTGSVTATALSATAIDGKTITGATVRTGSGLPRTQLTSTGLEYLNSSGTSIARIGSVAASGAIEATLTSGVYGVYVTGSAALAGIQVSVSTSGATVSGQNSSSGLGAYFDTNTGVAGRFTRTTGGNQVDLATSLYAVDATVGGIRTVGQLTSTLATGTAPIVVTSTTLCTNLNAQFLNGNASSAFLGATATAADSSKLGGRNVAASGAWFGGTTGTVPFLSGVTGGDQLTGGVLDGPQYIDFHAADTETIDYRARLYVSGGSSTLVGSGRLKFIGRGVNASNVAADNVDQFVLAGTRYGTDGSVPGTNPSMSTNNIPTEATSTVLRWIKAELNGEVIFIPYVK